MEGELEGVFEILNDRDKIILENAKAELMEDLKTRPLSVLDEGDLISYNLCDEDPVIREIVIRYNNKEYIFTISDIEVKKHV